MAENATTQRHEIMNKVYSCSFKLPRRSLLDVLLSNCRRGSLHFIDFINLRFSIYWMFAITGRALLLLLWQSPALSVGPSGFPGWGVCCGFLKTAGIQTFLRSAMRWVGEGAGELGDLRLQLQSARTPPTLNRCCSGANL